jgi:hypothetical protein
MVRTARAHLAQALPRTSRRREGVTRPCLRFRIVDSDHPIRYLVLYSSLNLWRRKHEKYTAHAQKKKILMGRAIHAPMASWARYSPSLAVSALDTKSMGRAGGAGGGDGGDGDIAHAARRITVPDVPAFGLGAVAPRSYRYSSACKVTKFIFRFGYRAVTTPNTAPRTNSFSHLGYISLALDTTKCLDVPGRRASSVATAGRAAARPPRDVLRPHPPPTQLGAVICRRPVSPDLTHHSLTH